MKKIKVIISAVALAAVVAIASIGTTGCTKTTLITNGVTNTVVTVDTNKLSEVREVLEPVVASGIRRALQNSPAHTAEIATYMRAVGQVFCDMHSGKQFSPAYLVDALSKVATPSLPDTYAIDIKNSVVAIYKIAFGKRFTSGFPADQWTDQVCVLICDSINTGLTDAGQAGLTK